MSGSTFGTLFKITTWRESNGRAIGVVVDGCPAGVPLSAPDIQQFLNRRKPGQSRYSTQRTESDLVRILSGVFEGKTTGTPISLLVENTDQRSHDYSEISQYYRPGHADYTYDAKYGFRDYRGGGRSSGRETIGRVAAGAIASKVLGTLGISLCSYVRSIGPVEISAFSREEITQNEFNMPDAKAAERAREFLEGCMARRDSAGGVAECIVSGMPAGAGNPVFDKLDANLGKALFSIGAVKGVEIGDGFAAARSCGTANNDSFYYDENGEIKKGTNHAGGILGGISDGSDIIVRAAFKPTPSVYSPQNTVNTSGENITVSIKGRHDPIIVARGVVVMESMVAIVLLDALMTGACAKLENLQKIWK